MRAALIKHEYKNTAFLRRTLDASQWVTSYVVSIDNL